MRKYVLEINVTCQKMKLWVNKHYLITFYRKKSKVRIRVMKKFNNNLILWIQFHIQTLLKIQNTYIASSNALWTMKLNRSCALTCQPHVSFSLSTKVLSFLLCCDQLNLLCKLIKYYIISHQGVCHGNSYFAKASMKSTFLSLL